MVEAHHKKQEDPTKLQNTFGRLFRNNPNDFYEKRRTSPIKNIKASQAADPTSRYKTQSKENFKRFLNRVDDDLKAR